MWRIVGQLLRCKRQELAACERVIELGQIASILEPLHEPRWRPVEGVVGEILKSGPEAVRAAKQLTREQPAEGEKLAVLTSRDGVHFEKPDLGRSLGGARNIVIDDPVGLGTLFVDPNAPDLSGQRPVDAVYLDEVTIRKTGGAA